MCLRVSVATTSENNTRQWLQRRGSVHQPMVGSLAHAGEKPRGPTVGLHRTTNATNLGSGGEPADQENNPPSRPPSHLSCGVSVRVLLVCRDMPYVIRLMLSRPGLSTLYLFGVLFPRKETSSLWWPLSCFASLLSRSLSSFFLHKKGKSLKRNSEPLPLPSENGRRSYLLSSSRRGSRRSRPPSDEA